MPDLKAFKKLIKAVETDSNPEAKHRTLESGLHEGMAAQGEMGLMPNTAQLMARRKLRDGTATPLDQIIATAEPTAIPEILSGNPDKYSEYADAYAKESLDKSNMNPLEGYFRYNFGNQAEDADIKNAMRTNPELVKRVQERMPLVSEPDTFVDKLPKINKEQLFSKIKKTVGN